MNDKCYNLFAETAFTLMGRLVAIDAALAKAEQAALYYYPAAEVERARAEVVSRLKAWARSSA